MATLADVVRRPQLGNIEAGRMPRLGDLKQDALGRRMVRLNQTRDNFGDYKGVGGTPQAKGPESFVPQALEAAKRVGVPAHKVTRPLVLSKLFRNRLGKGSPGPVSETVNNLNRLRGGL